MTYYAVVDEEGATVDSWYSDDMEFFMLRYGDSPHRMGMNVVVQRITVEAPAPSPEAFVSWFKAKGVW